MRYYGILILTGFLLFTFSKLQAKDTLKYDIIVSADGSGDFTSVKDAINSCRGFMDYETVIFVKNGVYKEKVVIRSDFINITIIGESAEKTIITNSDHAGLPGFGTFNSYTFQVLGSNITLKNLTIENASGEVGQAVALHVEGDRVRVENCRLLGNQDTLYATGLKSRQHYINCYIEGTTDFIFGSAIAVFDSCQLHCKRNSYITAASTQKERKFGYVFRNCKITAEPDVDKMYLGRPWRDYANVVFLNCEMGDFIRPEGWHNWGKENREKTAFYAEYKNSGPGAETAKRVSWSHVLSDKETKQYTLENMYSVCDSWDRE